MTEALPAVVREPLAQQNFDKLNSRLGSVEGKFPITLSEMATESVDVPQFTAAAKQLFLQLAEAAQRKINFGEASVTWVASKESAEVEVKHGLGVAPKAVLLTVKNVVGGTASGLTAVVTATPTEAAFKFKASCSESISATLAVYWQAIG